MSNKLADMSKVAESDEGVDVHVQGDVQRDTVERMIESCGTGNESCCGPEFFERVSDISVDGKDGDVTIHVSGQVTPGMIEQNLSECDCYDKQLAADVAGSDTDPES